MPRRRRRPGRQRGERSAREISRRPSADAGRTPAPDVRLGTWFVERGWKENPEYDADGPDGTAFGYEREKVLCFVSVHWDGGDDSDPDAVPEDWFEVRIACVANGPDAPGKP